MAPKTRRNLRITPSPGPSEPQEFDTLKNKRFYDAWDSPNRTKSMRVITRETGVSEGTGRSWKKQRKNLGSIVYRKTRKRSTKLGRRSKVTKINLQDARLTVPKFCPKSPSRRAAGILQDTCSERLIDAETQGAY